MIDCKQLPIPKYKVGDKVWIVNYLSVEEVEIDCVEIKGIWFDNGYTSRHEFEVKYEVSKGGTVQYRENQFYNSKRTAQRVLSKEKRDIRKSNIEQLRKNLSDLKSRCSFYGLTIEDL